jgi:hypothetical protein
VNGGIAFVLHNPSEPHVRLSTGGAPEAFALQDKVARSWGNFARTGNPAQPGLEWKLFTVADPQTMVFDAVSECRNMNDDKLASFMPNQGARRGQAGAGPRAHLATGVNRPCDRRSNVLTLDFGGCQV